MIFVSYFNISSKSLDPIIQHIFLLGLAESQGIEFILPIEVGQEDIFWDQTIASQTK